MQSFRPHTQSLYLILFFLFTYLLPISSAATTKCIPIIPKISGTFISARSTLPGYYAQPYTPKTPAEILTRLDSESRIRAKLNALEIDGKNYTAFNDYFLPNVSILFNSSVGLIQGLDNFIKLTENAVKDVDTQIILTPQAIRVYDESPCTASTFAYFEQTTFGRGALQGKSVVLKGDFRDRWAQDSETREWKVALRVITFIGYPVGDLTLNEDGSVKQ